MARVVETRKLKATYFGGGHLYSVQSTEKIENGYIGVLGDLVKGEKEVREFKKITDITENGKEIVLIAQPEIRYDYENRADKRRFEDFTIDDGATVRAYTLSIGDEFGLSLESIKPKNDNLVIGNKVILKNDSFELEEKTNDEVNNAKFVLNIEGFYYMNRMIQVAKGKVLTPTKMVILRVVKNEM